MMSVNTSANGHRQRRLLEMYEILANYWIPNLAFKRMSKALIKYMMGAAWCDFCQTENKPLFLVVGTYGRSQEPLVDCIVCEDCKRKVNNLTLHPSLSGRPMEAA
jgi:hypothetical protein